MEGKQCSICKEVKNLSDYYYQNKKSNKKGDYIYYNPECKECTKSKYKKWVENNLDRKRENTRQWRRKSENKHIFRNNQKKYIKGKKFKEWKKDNKDKFREYQIKRKMNKEHQISKEEWKFCLDYFDYSCAYCGMTEEDAKIKYNNYLHKEHVEHNGSNDISNCVPSCKSCNSKKWEYQLDEWYNCNNEVFSDTRLDKIQNWINKDHKIQLEVNGR